MPTINWDENKPAGQDSLGLGDDEIRSLKTALRAGLGAEHVWPSTGGDAGVHQLGSARAFVGTESQVSSAGTDGRLMVTSDSSRLFHVGSTGTMFLGGSNGLQFNAAIDQRSIWDSDMTLGTAGSIIFPNSGYSGIPFVIITTLGAQPAIVNITSITKTTATYAASLGDFTDVTSSTTVTCFSIGTRTL